MQTRGINQVSKIVDIMSALSPKSANNDDSSVAISIPVPVCGEEVNCEGGFAARDLVSVK